jgi:LacI family transcriptional regulator
VAILIETSNAYGRGLLAGVHTHKDAADDWMMVVAEHARGAPPLADVARWQAEGVVARIENEAIARAVERLGIPAIDVSAARLLPAVPFVETDDRHIARLAVEHLLELGDVHLAYCGNQRFRWSENRRLNFEAEAAGRGRSVAVFHPRLRMRRDGVADDAELGDWLQSLPKPAAIFACYDALALQLIEACHWRGIPVPDDVAILGVDDDELLCRLSTPPLSSITPDARQAGRLAAALLDRRFRREAVSIEHLVPPRGVAVRQSTDMFASSDPIVSSAVRFIRDNAHRGIKVIDVAQASSASRRALEQVFLKQLGRTPHEEILRLQFRLVEDLLRRTDMKLAAIARRCGFKHPEYMTAAFTKRHGIPPREFRRRSRDTGCPID